MTAVGEVVSSVELLLTAIDVDEGAIVEVGFGIEEVDSVISSVICAWACVIGKEVTCSVIFSSCGRWISFFLLATDATFFCCCGDFSLLPWLILLIKNILYVSKKKKLIQKNI